MEKLRDRRGRATSASISSSGISSTGALDDKVHPRSNVQSEPYAVSAQSSGDLRLRAASSSDGAAASVVAA